MNQLNCLQCRFARVLPQTDFAQRGTIIHCAAKPVAEEVGPRVINFGGCPSAQPTKRQGSGREWNALAEAFLRHWMPGSTPDRRPRIAELVGRSLATTLRHAHKIGADYPPTRAQYRARWETIRAKRGDLFTPEQAEFIRAEYRAGRWPTCIGVSNPTGKSVRSREQNDALRESIVRAVAGRGTEKSWGAIISFVYRDSPSYKRRKRARRR